MKPKMAIREKPSRETNQVDEPQYCDSLLPLLMYLTFPPYLRHFLSCMCLLWHSSQIFLSSRNPRGAEGDDGELRGEDIVMTMDV